MKIIIIVDGGNIHEVRRDYAPGGLDVEILDMDNKRAEGLSADEREAAVVAAMAAAPHSIDARYI